MNNQLDRDKEVNRLDFPTDAFEFTKPGDATPTLTLKAGWDFAIAADLDVDGATTLNTLVTSGAGEIGGNLQVLGSTKADGHFYTGTTTPTNTTRLNYDGNFHTTNLTTGTINTTSGETRLNWYKIADPTTDADGYIATKTSGWTADRFTASSGGLEVDFSAVVTAGTKAVKVSILILTTTAIVCSRPAGDDTYADNTPIASLHYHSIIASVIGRYQVEILLSSTYKAEFSVSDTGCDLYVSFPYMELR